MESLSLIAQIWLLVIVFCMGMAIGAWIPGSAERAIDRQMEEDRRKVREDVDRVHALRLMLELAIKEARNGDDASLRAVLAGLVDGFEEEPDG